MGPEAHGVGFVGIDLTSSPRKPSAYALLDAESEPVFYDFFTDEEIVAAIGRDRPLLVAIDAPLSLPLGLCCLEEDCPCGPISVEKGRACERDLAKLGIPCYFTTKRSIIKQMVYRALALKEELVGQGHEVIEVYPYASKVRLFGKLPPKTKPAGIKVLTEHMALLLPGLARHEARLNHDLCDALLAAYTAYLKHSGGAELLGDPEEGLLAIPIRGLPLCVYRDITAVQSLSAAALGSSSP